MSKNNKSSEEELTLLQTLVIDQELQLTECAGGLKGDMRNV